MHSDDLWVEANQRALAAALTVVNSKLSALIARSHGKSDDFEVEEGKGFEEQYSIALKICHPPPALETLTGLFGLSSFERDVLLVCAGMELESRFRQLLATDSGKAELAYPSFGLLLSLRNAHWSALATNRPLRRWQLVEFGSGGLSAAPLTTRPLRIDERILHYLTGLHCMDERVRRILNPFISRAHLTSAHQAIARDITAAWSAEGQAGTPIIVLRGTDAAVAKSVALHSCRSVGLNLLAFSVRALISDGGETRSAIELCDREALLSGSAILVESDDEGIEVGALRSILHQLVMLIRSPLIVVSQEHRRFKDRAMATFEVKPSPLRDQKAMWTQALGLDAERLNGRLDTLAAQFSLNSDQVLSAVHQAKGQSGGTLDFHSVWDACRVQARVGFESLAQRLDPSATWADLILPEAQKTVLRDILAHVRGRAKVYETWGFAGKSTRGLGISALFAGTSGTGKTMAAEVLAQELRLDLYRIDLSTIVSKYIGETEKNLRQIFHAAETAGAILLFDEADALFGKRSEVKDSHDRYANIEVAYLLQRVETYQGLSILTTNMKTSIDAAFLRRIRFVVQFPFPDSSQRAEIWRRVFPSQTPTDDLDVERLSQLSVAGGNIRNIALNAAFAAANAGERVGMNHILHAAHSEYAKLEKTMVATETAGWT